MWPELKRFLRTYVRPRKWKFGVVQAMHVAAVLLLIASPLLIRYILDNVLPEKDLRALALSAGAIVAAYGVWAVVQGLKEYWGHEVAQGITSRLRNDLYGHLQKLSMSFHDNKKTGELLSRIVDDINVIQEFVHHGPETVIIGVVTLLGTGAVMVWMEWRLALVALCVVPLQILIARRPVGNMLRQFKQVRKEKASLSDVLEENLSGVRVIQAFTSEEKETGEVSRANEEHYRSRMGAIRYIATLFPLTMFINAVGLAAILLYGGYLAFSTGYPSVGTLTAFILLVQRFHQPILRMMMMAERGGEFFAGIERFFDYMDIEPDIADRAGAKALSGVEGEVRFENVHFSYEDETVLRGVSLAARPGQMVALVGPSGAGKTTITRLIPRFYDPFRGRVLLDGVDVRDIKLRSLRAHVGIVMQDDFLFSGTVAENIRYGKRRASREEIVRAARLANAAPFVEKLPDGYDTEIGKRGVKLSEGQRQRISIARALLKNPQILILDEATSSVDSETEVLIQQAVERLREGRTTFAIAHRLSTILNADQILFVDGGRIIERGTHEELMELDGEYARFYKIQYGEVDLAARKARRA
ncbi:MAG: ABC transporter ATP-binding protein [Candidatus Brocadiaceae bacterium]|jgi:ATP-binding cassette subfamily B protein